METALRMEEVASCVKTALSEQPIIDVHTHLYPPSFGTPTHNSAGLTDPHGLMLWGVDELITYHYLVAEVFRVVPTSTLSYDRFWSMTKHEQADFIWSRLFEDRAPISEACRGVVTTLNRLGLDPRSDGLQRIRAYFADQNPDAYIGRVMDLANVKQITMTNAVFDDQERNRWLADSGSLRDSRFRAVLRIDPLVVEWEAAGKRLREWGYDTDSELSARSCESARRFLGEWVTRMDAAYIAASLPPEFRYPVSRAAEVLDKVVFPVCLERGIAFAMMIGARRGANPALRDAGDVVGKGDVTSVSAICAAYPQNRFLVTMLSREDQHELAVVARKFGNLMPFGCWWFLNNPSLVREITQMRLELLGTSFIPQHSDARILDQLIYKWDHSKRAIGEVLTEQYIKLMESGWQLTKSEVRSDCERLLAGNAMSFLSPQKERL